MKRFLKSLFQFTILVIIMYPAYIIIWGEFAPRVLQRNMLYQKGGTGFLYTRINEVKKINSADILFLGSSRTYRGFDVRIFDNAGYKSFNLGSSSQTPVQTNVLLERYLDSIAPKNVVYEVYPIGFMSDGVESSLDLISNDLNDSHSWEMAKEINHITTYNTLLFGYYNDLVHSNSYFKESLHRNHDTYIPGGYVETELKMNDGKHKFPDRKIEIKELQIAAFKKNLKLLKDKGVNVVLVYAPVTKQLYNSYTNITEFNKTMEEYGDYYNFNEIIKLNDSTDFMDGHHLNQKGVEAFNKSVLSVIKFKK